jgi:carbamate kinase
LTKTQDSFARIVVALGGNALLRRGEAQTVEAQRNNLRAATSVLARLARAHSLVVTHGNGPQVGLLAIQSEALAGTAPLPLDVLGAQTQGMIGYLIEDELRDALQGDREVATLLTQVVVDAADPAFESPTKPIGPVYDEATARLLAEQRGWAVARDGEYWRRVVASPRPKRILEIRSLRVLLDAEIVVICAGGGGVPVVAEASGGWRGVEAVVDKDLSAALLADQLNADALLLLTDVDAVYENWGTDRAKPIRSTTPEMLKTMSFAEGSMGPKVEAACQFIEAPGDGPDAARRVACIGALGDAATMLRGEAGTRIVRNPVD